MNERVNQLDADGDVGLSPAGMARRQAMLGELHSALAAKRRRRVVTRAVGAAALAISVATGAWLVVRPPNVPAGTSGSDIVAAPTKETVPVAAAAIESNGGTEPFRAGAQVAMMSDRTPRVEIIGPDAWVMLRMAIAPDRPSRIEVLDDLTLTRTLAAKGENVGIARVGGKVMLVAN